MRRCIFWFLWSLVLVNAASAESIPKRQTLTIVFEEYPPYEFAIPGDVDGLTIRKVRKACTELGIKPIFIPAPWTRALYMASNGEVDGILSLHQTEERKKTLLYPALPLAENEDRLYSMKKKNLSIISSYEVLQPYSVGVVSDNSYGKDFDGLTYLKKIFARDHRNLIERLEKGWIDYIVINNNVFDVHRRELKLDAELFVQHPLIINKESLYIAFSKKIADHQWLADSFSILLAKYATEPVSSLPIDKICKIGDSGCGPILK